MQKTSTIMGMPVSITIADPKATSRDIEGVFAYFHSIDQQFSTYKETSEISRLNTGRITPTNTSEIMQHILYLAEQTRRQTHGYFNINRHGHLDPSGIVKGWAIWQAAEQLSQKGFRNILLDIGSDIEARGTNSNGKPWRIGIRHPLDSRQIVKVIQLSDRGIATSGTSERGQHIYDPHQPNKLLTEVLSLTVIGPNIYEADRFATAAFAMGKEGIHFIEKQPNLEGYQIDRHGRATLTSGCNQYIALT